MDQLDLLKKDWKKQESTLPKISKETLSKVIHKKSSSIVKWIFIISVLELIIPVIISLFTSSAKSSVSIEKLNLTTFINTFYGFYYIILLGFIYYFYKNYKSISADANPKVLIQNILKTRKIVKYYIWFNLALIPILCSVVFYHFFKSDIFLNQIPNDTNMLVVWLLSLFLILILVILFWLFYQLIYGILLKRLNRNYKELVSNGDNF